MLRPVLQISRWFNHIIIQVNMKQLLKFTAIEKYTSREQIVLWWMRRSFSQGVLSSIVNINLLNVFVEYGMLKTIMMKTNLMQMVSPVFIWFKYQSLTSLSAHSVWSEFHVSQGWTACLYIPLTSHTEIKAILPKTSDICGAKKKALSTDEMMLS